VPRERHNLVDQLFHAASQLSEPDSTGGTHGLVTLFGQNWSIPSASPTASASASSALIWRSISSSDLLAMVALQSITSVKVHCRRYRHVTGDRGIGVFR
jgi:hypothetical protein